MEIRKIAIEPGNALAAVAIAGAWVSAETLVHLVCHLLLPGLRTGATPALVSIYIAKGGLAGALALYYFFHKDQGALLAGAPGHRILSLNFLGWAALFVLLKGALASLSMILPDAGGDYCPEIQSLASSSAGILMVVVIGPILEEVFFRGYLLHRLLRVQSRAVSILIASALFAALHFDRETLVPAFLIGLFLSGVMVRTRHLGYCILLHALNNLGAVLAAWWLAGP